MYLVRNLTLLRKEWCWVASFLGWHGRDEMQKGLSSSTTFHDRFAGVFCAVLTLLAQKSNAALSAGGGRRFRLGGRGPWE